MLVFGRLVGVVEGFKTAKQHGLPGWNGSIFETHSDVKTLRLNLV